jgi:1-acyl-sn-glycerol-3-phosphate acyltransferase
MAHPIFRFLFALMRLLMRLIARVEVVNLEATRQTGGLIVAGNHLGRLDPFLVYTLLDRKDIIMLVAEKYQKVAILRWVVKQVDGIFVDRFNADFHALRVVLKRLKGGGLLVMSPEGTRSTTGGLIEGRPGAAYLAAKSGLPIVPVAGFGGEDRRVIECLKHFRRVDIHLRLGEPFTLPSLPTRDREAALQQYTDEIMCRIAALLPAAYRGVYADHPRLKELLAEREGADRLIGQINTEEMENSYGSSS